MYAICIQDDVTRLVLHCITTVIGHRNQSSSKVVHNNLMLLKNDENDALK